MDMVDIFTSRTFLAQFDLVFGGAFVNEESVSGRSIRQHGWPQHGHRPILSLLHVESKPSFRVPTNTRHTGFPGLCKLWHCTNSTSDLRIKFDSVRKHTHTHTLHSVLGFRPHHLWKMYFQIEIKTCLRIEKYFLLSDSNCLDLPFLLGVHWHWHWRRKHRLKEVFTLFYSGSIAKQNRSWWQGATKKSNCSKRRDKNYFKLLVECYYRSFTNRKPPVDS